MIESKLVSAHFLHALNGLIAFGSEYSGIYYYHDMMADGYWLLLFSFHSVHQVQQFLLPLMGIFYLIRISQCAQSESKISH